MSTRKYKLSYFDVKALGEPARYMFALADVPYEDNRLNFNDWPTLKSSFPFGQVPVLEVDGSEAIPQSRAICRFLGSQFDLLPASDLERFRADAVVDIIDDVRRLMPPIIVATRSGDTETKEKLAKKYEEEQLPQMFGDIEKFLKSDKFIAGNELSWADVYFTAMLEFVRNGGKWTGFDTKLENFPKISGIMNNVFSQPRIVAYVAGRKTGDPDL